MTSDQPAPHLPEPTPGTTPPELIPEAQTPPDAGKPDKKTPDKGKAPVDQSSKFTRAGALWSALIMGFLVLIVLLIFIAQNTEPVPLAFLGWRWSLPTGVAILGAAVAGGLLTVAAGTARIFQLRRTAKKNLKAALRG
ncbi:lipopolysaccharide assembly LapA domain-containing protein [Mycolicibacterium sp.]|uniref:lipopolysaccharide assembly LapA domain-containing protein n=1 Tax=Mycolicibacterium sp. TaxID=2320850 RepID=UPI0037C61597